MSKMAVPRGSAFLDPASAFVAGGPAYKQKAAAVREAKLQEEAIHERLRRIGHEIPKYTFLELIGKGAYGRVFKSYDVENNRIVALKVIDVDSTDYKSNARAKDDTIEVTIHEIKVLKQLKDSKAKNVNIFYDAFQIHSQLWIVNDYCPGGSVHTLMRATGNKLEDKYILPIARELAAGLKAIHDAGIIHRDVKSANIMIHENGSLQIIDFGVAGILQSKLDKRNTIIGTPHWMPPELHKNAPPEGLHYGTEVDVWAYGCTLYEMATGQPPNARVEPGRRLGATIGRNPPRLNGGQHSDGLRELVAFALEGKPADRPNMVQILQQPYIAGTEFDYPTDSLAELVKIYYRWEFSGGQRQSLFYEGGAAAAEFPKTLHEEEEWNFSTTAGFEQQFASEEISPMSQPKITIDTALAQSSPDDPTSARSATSATRTPIDFSSPYLPHNPYEFDPSDSTSELDNYLLDSSAIPLYSSAVGNNISSYALTQNHAARMAMNPEDQYEQERQEEREERVKRGKKAMEGIFDPKKADYKYEVKDDFENAMATKKSNSALPRTGSDLPLRPFTNESAVHQELEYSVSNLRPDALDMPNIDLANVNTIKANRMNRNGRDDDRTPGIYEYGKQDAKRATKDWKFPSFDEDINTDAAEHAAESSKRVTKDWKFPSFDEAQTMPASTNVPDSSKRATLDWKFPAAMFEENRPPVPRRPTLPYSATAPTGNLQHQSIAILDLDELWDPNASFSSFDNSSLASPTTSTNEATPNLSQDTTISAQSSFDEMFPNSPESDMSTSQVISEASTLRPDDGGSNSKRRSGGLPKLASDGEHLTIEEMNIYDPFLFHHFPGAEGKSAINAYLDKQGITDELEKAGHRRQLLEGRKGTLKIMKEDLYQSGYKEFLKRKLLRPQGKFDLPADDPSASWWSKYDLDTNPAPGLFPIDDKKAGAGGAEADDEASEAGGEEDHHDADVHDDDESGDDEAAGLSGSAFDNLVPPSAESLMEGASAPVVEGELRRLLIQWNRGLGELAEAFDHATAHRRHESAGDED